MTENVYVTYVRRRRFGPWKLAPQTERRVYTVEEWERRQRGTTLAAMRAEGLDERFAIAEVCYRQDRRITELTGFVIRAEPDRSRVLVQWFDGNGPHAEWLTATRDRVQAIVDRGVLTAVAIIVQDISSRPEEEG